VLPHLLQVGFLRVPGQVRQPVVVSYVVLVASLVLRAWLRADMRLEHEDGHVGFAAPLTVPQGGVHVALALALVRAPGDLAAEMPAAVPVLPGRPAHPAEAGDLMGPARQLLPRLRVRILLDGEG
jgi:hypothetical protein